VRRLVTLIEGLPKTSRLARSLVPEAEWSEEAHLLALLGERFDAGLRQLYELIGAANTPKGRAAPKPWKQLEIPRPGSQRVDEGLSIESVRAAFASVN
jgi:hypothetical protein